MASSPPRPSAPPDRKPGCKVDALERAPITSPLMGRGIALLAIITAASLGSATPALGAPSFLAPSDISVAGADAAATHVAMDAAGDSFATWFRFDGSNQRVQAAVRPAGGSFGAPQDLSAGGADAAAPVIASDFGGDATASWYRFNGTNYIVQASSKPAGGSFGAAVDLSSGTKDARFPSVAMDPAGNVLVAWVLNNGSNYIVQASYKPVNGSFSSPVDLSAGGQDATDAHAALDNAGNALVTWERSDGTNNIVQAAFRPVSGSFASATNLSLPGGTAQDARVAFDPAGNAFATWRRFDGLHFIVQAAYRPAGGGFASARNVSVAGADAGEPPRAAFDAFGNAVIAFTRSDGAHQRAQAAFVPAAGNIGAPQDLSDAGQDAQSPEVIFDGASDAIVTWFRPSSGSNYMQAAVRPPNASFGAVLNISTANSQAQDMAADPFGNAVLTWQHFNGTNLVIQAVGVDGAGPQLRGLSVPASGFVGQPLTFGVAPLDVWSAVGPTSWNFGDGTNAPGTTVTHAYAAAGTYQVRVASVDALGNISASAPVPVQIAPLPVPPRPAAASIGTLSFNGRVLSVSIACADQTCNGRLNLLAFDDGATIAAAKKKKKKKRHHQFTAATARFSIPAGRTQTVKLTLTSKARALLNKRRRLPVVLQLKLDGQSATRTPTTLHAKGKKKTTKKK